MMLPQYRDEYLTYMSVCSPVSTFTFSRFLLECHGADSFCPYPLVFDEPSALLDFCEHLVQPKGVEDSFLEKASVLHGLHYMRNIVEANPRLLQDSICASCLFVGCLVVSTKYVQESGGRSNREWARISCLDLEYLNRLEKDVLTLLRFDLLMSPTQYAELENLLQFDPVVLGWFTGKYNTAHSRCDGSRFCCGSNLTLQAPVYYEERLDSVADSEVTQVFKSMASDNGKMSKNVTVPKISNMFDYQQILHHLQTC
eukprot:CFRG3664T1